VELVYSGNPRTHEGQLLAMFNIQCLVHSSKHTTNQAVKVKIYEMSTSLTRLSHPQIIVPCNKYIINNRYVM